MRWIKYSVKVKSKFKNIMNLCCPQQQKKYNKYSIIVRTFLQMECDRSGSAGKTLYSPTHPATCFLRQKKYISSDLPRHPEGLGVLLIFKGTKQPSSVFSLRIDIILSGIKVPANLILSFLPADAEM